MFNVASLPQTHQILNLGLNNKNKAVAMINSYALSKRPTTCFVILLHNHNIRFDFMMFYLSIERFAVQKFTWEPMSPDSETLNTDAEILYKPTARS